ncbi:NAD(P)/FAD-dependent oxidoreductase [Natronorarus salvus]|uniref:NAD(P)/FAD-dependent oxidoreductase n=1 Tax=Natronorarus salvus TaxID=3117733 RepID=UPI002F26C41B
MRVCVIGGGAVGVTTAYDLAVEGCAVRLAERGGIGSGSAGSTGRAAGVVYDAFSDRIDAEIARRSVEHYREVSGSGGFEFHEVPYVWLAREGDGKRERLIREQVPRMREHGLNVELLVPDELADRFPSLRTEDVAIAGVAADAGCTDPGTYPRAMADLARGAGVEVRTDVEARLSTDPLGVDLGSGVETFDRVVVTAGAWTKRLLADAGVPIAMKPYRVQALRTTDRPADVPMVYDATAGVYLRPWDDRLLVGDGTELVESDPDEWEREGDPIFVDSALDCAAHRLDVHLDVAEAWAGLCTATPDQNPLCGELRDGLFVATGWQGHGFMRAPGIAERLANEVLGGEGVEGFDPRRFSGDETFEIREGMAVEGR